MLTKSHYLAYTHCPKRLWLELNFPERAAPPDADAQRRLRQGQQVDRMARRSRPDGELIPSNLKNVERAETTAAAIEAGAPTIFQGTFIADDLLVQVDIMERLPDDSWHLIEVKASSRYKKEQHLPDVAFQRLVVERAGVPVSRVSVMHVNKTCRHPRLDQLFNLHDVTVDSAAMLPHIEEQLPDLRRAAAVEREPNLAIGKHCLNHHRRQCDYHSYCWADIDGQTIYEIPYLSKEKIGELEERDVLYVEELPAGFDLGDRRCNRYVNLLIRQRREIDRPAIRRRLAELQYPLYFFDFEAIDHPIPRYPGANPYMPVPFQFSCHVMQRDGSVDHVDFLHAKRTDPRPELIDAMSSLFENLGSIVAYNISYEQRVIRTLADCFPQWAGDLEPLLDRFWDQLPIFRNYYRDYRCGGSASLKAVLPVVVPELSYKELAVQNGIQAQVEWENLIEMASGPERDAAADALRAYCHMDTLAMVELHRVLVEL